MTELSLVTRQLLSEDWQNWQPRLIAGDYSPAGEYHVVDQLLEAQWWEPTIHSSMRAHSRGNWRVVSDRHGRRYLEQTAYHPHVPEVPMLVTGDPQWMITEIETTLRVLAGIPHTRGLLCRYVHSRNYLAIECVAGELRIRRRHHDEQQIVASIPFAPNPDCEHVLLVQFTDDTLSVYIDGQQYLQALVGVQEVGAGRVGFFANQVTRFGGITVTGHADEDQPKARPAAPVPRLWKQLDCQGWGTDRNLRWGDVTGDGRPEVVMATRSDRYRGDNHSTLSSLAVMNLDGELLWTRGAPGGMQMATTSDLCFQVHDLDGIGRAQVIYCWDDELVVADGRDGSDLRSVTLPRRPEAADDFFPRLLGDSICFADLSGSGRADCLLVKDRYQNMHAYNRHLHHLWSYTGKTGHFPYPVDLNGDGRDEILIGYSCLNADGTVLWSHDEDIDDHADNVCAWQLADESGRPSGHWRIVYAASDAGLYLLDAEGHILHQYPIGHGQSSAICRLAGSPDSLSLIMNTFWGAAGITAVMDQGGRVRHEAEPMPYACLLQAVNWQACQPGDLPADLLLLSTHPVQGGLVDASLQRQVLFPDDGHPVLCSDARDLDGDGIDEIITWDETSIWIYKADVPGRTLANYPRRAPWYNDSNYRTQISLPVPS